MYCLMFDDDEIFNKDLLIHSFSHTFATMCVNIHTVERLNAHFIENKDAHNQLFKDSHHDSTLAVYLLFCFIQIKFKLSI